jgi:putative NADH-flavin reductase
MNKSIKIAVIGGTGKAGRYVIKHLIDHDYNIKVLVRDPDKLNLTNQHVEKIVGNVLNYESVYSLLDGCSVVISTLGQTKGEDPVFTLATKNIIKAMESLKIKRYIVLTGLTLDTPSDKKGFSTRMRSLAMKLLFKSIVVDKREEYSILNQSNLIWTVVRVPFIEISDERKVTNVNLLDCHGSKISSTSLAEFLTGQIENQNYLKKAPFIWNT